MSSIPESSTLVVAAQADATNQKINLALLRKSLDTQKQTGDAIQALIEQAAKLQTQLASGHIDVKV